MKQNIIPPSINTSVADSIRLATAHDTKISKDDAASILRNTLATVSISFSPL